MGATKYLGQINAADIPFRTGGQKGLAFDIRKYFANNSTATNRPMVFDEIRLMLDISVVNQTDFVYLRFGVDGGSTQIVNRNMLTLQPDGSVDCAVGGNANAIVGIRIGSNTELIIRPHGGSARKPALADNLTLVTITDNSSVSFGNGNTRVNLNTLYRLSFSDNKMYLYQSEYNGTCFNGNIKIYGVKYPTA